MKDLYDRNYVKTAECVREIVANDQKFKESWGKQAKQWVAFANGDQSVETFRGAAPIINNFQPQVYTYDTRQNAYITNEIDPIVRTLAAYMCRSKPAVDCYPTDKDDDGERHAAEVAELVHNSKYEIDNEYLISRQAAFWGLSIGNVYVKDYWNAQKGVTGDNDIAVLTPLSMTVDDTCIEFDRQPYIIESYLAPTDWAKDVYNSTEQGYTGNIGALNNDTGNLATLNYLEEMKFSIPYKGYQNFSKDSKDKTLIQEVYLRPSNNWPQGRYLILAAGQVVYDSPPEIGSPYFMPYDEEMWHPYTYFGFEPYIGRFLHKGVVESIMPLQLRLNEINGAILENANTIAKPNILAAVNQLKKGIISGAGSTVYTYNYIPGAPAPTVFAGAPLPSQFFEEKKELIEAMVRIAGTNFVMSGQPPKGVSAASAISQLLENATTQLSDIMKTWEHFHERRYQKKLRIIHKFGQYPNTKLNNYLSYLQKDLLNCQVRDFVGQQDLSSGTVLKIQYGSMMPKNETVKRDMYSNWAKEGLLGAVGEPTPKGTKLRKELLARFGEKPLDSEESVELKKAEWENDRIIHGLPVEVSPYDIGPIHILTHTTKIQDPSFLEKATDEQKIGLDNHIQAHQKVEAEKQAQQMMQMAQMQGNPEEAQQKQPAPPQGA